MAVAALCASPACISYTPMPLDPPEELALLESRAGTSLVLEQEGPWRSSWFPLESNVQLADGVTLAEANALALFYSPEILVAHADAKVAGSQVLQAGVLDNPELYMGPRLSTKDAQLIFPAAISWTLPLWGKIDARRGVAEARLTEKELNAIEVELDVLRRVRESFLKLVRLQRESKVLSKVKDSSKQIVTWVESLQRAGEVDAVVLYLARSERDEAAAAFEQVQFERRRVRRELYSLMGLLPTAAVDIVVDSSSASLPDLPEPQRDALLKLPTLRTAEAAYARSESELRLEISKQYPEIRLGPEYEYDRGDSSLGLGVGISLPIFDQNTGAIRAAEEARRRARQRYDTELLRASHQEARARDKLTTAERQLEIYRVGALSHAEDAARALDVRLRIGRAGVVDVLAAQRAIARARGRMLELEEQSAVARMRASIAGGFALQQPSPEKPVEVK